MRGLLALVLVTAACAETALPSPATSAAPAPATASLAPAAPSPTPHAHSADIVPDAGVLIVRTPDGNVRYDGATGTLERLATSGALAHADLAGAYFTHPSDGLRLVRWDGRIVSFDCGPGAAVAFAPNGACASIDARSGTFARLPGERAPRRILPADWGAAGMAWSPDGQRLALLRRIGGAAEAERDRNALWLLEADGSLRELARPLRPASLLWRPLWSPDGARLALWEIAAPTTGIAPTAGRLRLLDVRSGASDEAGSAPLEPTWLQWSVDGRLAWVAGTGSDLQHHQAVIVRERDGAQRITVGTPNEWVSFAPTWDPAGTRLAYVAGPWGGANAQRRAYLWDARGTPAEVGCSDRSVDGVRWSSDGEALLLLCRRRDSSGDLEIWLHRLDARGGAAVRLFALAADALGATPSLFRIAWSRGVR